MCELHNLWQCLPFSVLACEHCIREPQLDNHSNDNGANPGDCQLLYLYIANGLLILPECLRLQCLWTYRQQLFRAVLSLSPNAVSSIRGYHRMEGVRLVNYADYTTPIAPSAWLGQANCINPVNCLPIVDDEFHPFLVVPEQVRALDHAWATCRLDFRGSYDPPRAYSPVQALASTTSTSDPHTISAAPLAPVPVPASSTVQTIPVSSPGNSRAESSVSPPSAFKDPVHSVIVYGDPSLGLSPTTDPKINSAAPISIDPNIISSHRPQTAAVSPVVVSPAAGVSPGSGVRPASTAAHAGAGDGFPEPGASNQHIPRIPQLYLLSDHKNTQLVLAEN